MRKSSIAVIMFAASGAIAQQPADQPPVTKLGTDTDPNQVVCVTEREIGSRLATNRVCRTRAEWTQRRAQFRERIDRAQKAAPPS